MHPIFEIKMVHGTELQITDKSYQNELYVPERVESELTLLNHYNNNNYKYSETFTINILRLNKTDESLNIGYTITSHDSYLDEAYFNIVQDGFYTVHHIILPSVEWFNRNKKSLPDVKYIYFTDGEKIYRYFKGDIEEIEDIYSLAIINTRDTNISRCTVKTFTLYYLYKCYIDVCKSLFRNINTKCINKNSDLDEATFIRDFLNMTINVIEYHISFEQHAEAERILEEVNYCGSFCKDSNKYSNKISSCGCGKGS